MGPLSTYSDKKSKDGLWLKGYTWVGVQSKTRAGRLWNNLETRTDGRHKDKCYDNAENGFKDFQEFAEWCQPQFGYMHVEQSGKFWQLDKDIIVPDNKVYSPDTCCFVPGRVNSALIEQRSEQGLPLGVSFNTNGERFVARYRNAQGRRVHIGVYDTPESAHSAWYSHKREAIRLILAQYDLSNRATEALKARWDL
jgi:hypothetical protein